METYSKHSDTELKITKSNEEIVPLREAKNTRQNLITQRDGLNEKIAQWDLVISEADKLGIVDAIASEQIEDVIPE